MIDNLYLNVGAMKAGTTWLYAHLKDHSDIHFSREKEIHYFTHINTYHSPLGESHRLSRFKDAMRHIDISEGNVVKVKEHLDWYKGYISGPIDDVWYKNLFSARQSERYVADFSNLYSNLDVTGWNHIKEISRNLRVTYIMRHPLARLWSHVKFHTKIVGEYEKMLEWSVEEFSDMVRRAFIWDNTEYCRVVKTLSDNLDPNQFKIIFFEDIHGNSLKALRELEQFLQIRPHQYDIDTLDQAVNVSPTLALPAAFKDQFKQDLVKEVKGLIELGYSLPESWNDLIEPSST